MSKIQQIQPNYQQKSNLNSKNQAICTSKQSFGSGAVDDAARAVAKKIESEYSPVMKIVKGISKFLDRNEGELQTQAINALFTGTLAPLMIYKNPFSKKDEKTKAYTAIRQPISAGIAISGGLAMTTAVNHFMDRMGSEGYLPSIDLRLEPSKDYMKGMLKQEYKKARKAGNKQSFYDYLASNYSKGIDPDIVDKKDTLLGRGDYKRECINNYMAGVKKEKKAFFQSLITSDPNSIRIDEKTTEIFVNNVPIGKNMPNLATSEELTKYLNSNNLYKRSLGELMKDDFKFEFYEDGKIKPSTVNDKLGKVKAMDFLRKLGFVDKEGGFDERELNRVLNALREENNSAQQVKKVFKPKAFVNAENGPVEFVQIMGKQESRAIQGAMGGELSNIEKMTLDQLLQRLGYTADNQAENIKNIEDLIKKPISEVITDLKGRGLDKLQILNKEKVGEFVTLASKKLTDFGNNMLTGKIDILSKNFKNFKGYTNILFNLGMTVITCTALNWIYPRFVEKFFPDLLKSDKPNKDQNSVKGGSK